MKKKAKMQEKPTTTAGNIVNDMMIKDGNDVLIIGRMNKPIHSHPKYPELVKYVDRMTGAYTQAIELAGKLLGLKIHVKLFLKVHEEDKPDVSV